MTAMEDAKLNVADANARAVTTNGETLSSLTERSPVLLVFLRHAGCTFCRQTLSDLHEQRKAIESRGLRIVIVHQGTPEEGQEMLKRFQLGDLSSISDPKCHLYRAYGLRRGDLKSILAPSVWWRGFRSVILEGHGAGKVSGDLFQLPGAFIVEGNRIRSQFLHTTPADRPNYCTL
jgi:peroxiredoxin